ncbi:hypothetical protein [Pseudomonas protegens]|uniref:hypothetical protein n=1 Tax=Pseudomonas protegens TaxID=380021 RepID=UPI000641FF11|nr:hypothetical protein [Pseudomonas protegens]
MDHLDAQVVELGGGQWSFAGADGDQFLEHGPYSVCIRALIACHSGEAFSSAIKIRTRVGRGLQPF